MPSGGVSTPSSLQKAIFVVWVDADVDDDDYTDDYDDDNLPQLVLSILLYRYVLKLLYVFTVNYKFKSQKYKSKI